MNKAEFVAAMAEKAGLSKKDAEKAVKAFTEIVSEELAKGEKIQLVGFGTFEVKKRMERVIVNPSTGQRMLVPPKLVLSFKPNASARETINQGGQQNG